MFDPSKPPVTLTDAAIARVRELVARSQEPVLGLRIGIKTRGCSGLSYFAEYAHEQKKFEDKVTIGEGDDAVTVFIDPTATMFLLGSEVDYVEDRFHTGFVFNNPNEDSRCGCGESFNVDPDKQAANEAALAGGPKG